MTQYDAQMPNVEIAYPPQTLKATLGEYLADLGLTQLRIAETENTLMLPSFSTAAWKLPTGTKIGFSFHRPRLLLTTCSRK